MVGRRHGVASYQIDHLYLANQMLSLRGKRVLEVGGSLPEAIVIDHYKCTEWMAVDDREAYEQKLNWARSTARQKLDDSDTDSMSRCRYFDGRIEDIPSSFHGKFDIVFSNAVLEHVDRLPEALGKMRAALAPGGSMYHTIGPIWSGPAGHHVYPSYFSEFGKNAGAGIVNQLRPWMHLAMTPEQMHDHLRTAVCDSIAEVAVQSIYSSPRINRLFFQQYLDTFRNENLDVAWIHRWKKKQKDTRFLHDLKLSETDREDYLFNVFTVILSPSTDTDRQASSSPHLSRSPV